MADFLTRTTSNLLESFSKRPALTGTLAALGTIWTTYQVYNLLSFTHLHFLRSSSLSRYQRGSKSQRSSAAWALVTGASDGIGKGFAEELCSQGFNVIIHGRKEKKLNGVKDELSKQWPDAEIKVLVFDAGADINDEGKLTAMIQEISSLNITILINNLGGGPFPSFMKLADGDLKRTQEWVNVNIMFTTEITRVMMPILNKNGPGLIMTVGSFAGSLGAPYVALYSACKGYEEIFMKALDNEIRAEGLDIEAIHLLVGMVKSGREPEREVSLLVPSSRGFAKAALEKVGCGVNAVAPYWPHGIQFSMMMGMPDWIFKRLVKKMAKEEYEKETLRLKGQ